MTTSQGDLPLDELHSDSEALKRKKVLLDMSTVKSLCFVLGEDFKQIIRASHPSLDGSGGMIDRSDQTLQSLSCVIARLRASKMLRTERLKYLAKCMMETWTLLNTPIPDIYPKLMDVISASQKDEITEPNALSMNFMLSVEDMYRLVELKKFKRQLFVLKKGDSGLTEDEVFKLEWASYGLINNEDARSLKHIHGVMDDYITRFSCLLRTITVDAEATYLRVMYFTKKHKDVPFYPLVNDRGQFLFMQMGEFNIENERSELSLPPPTYGITSSDVHSPKDLFYWIAMKGGIWIKSVAEHYAEKFGLDTTILRSSYQVEDTSVNECYEFVAKSVPLHYKRISGEYHTSWINMKEIQNRHELFRLAWRLVYSTDHDGALATMMEQNHKSYDKSWAEGAMHIEKYRNKWNSSPSFDDLWPEDSTVDVDFYIEKYKNSMRGYGPSGRGVYIVWLEASREDHLLYPPVYVDDDEWKKMEERRKRTEDDNEEDSDDNFDWDEDSDGGEDYDNEVNEDSDEDYDDDKEDENDDEDEGEDGEEEDENEGDDGVEEEYSFVGDSDNDETLDDVGWGTFKYKAYRMIIFGVHTSDKGRPLSNWMKST